MNISQIRELINEFTSVMSSHYPLLEYIITYDKQDNDFVIEHNYKNWQDSDFSLLKINLMKDIFESKDIYNVCFAYSSDVKSATVLNKTIPLKINFNLGASALYIKCAPFIYMERRCQYELYRVDVRLGK